MNEITAKALQKTRLLTLGLVFLYLLTYLFPLDLRPLSIPDETRYAEIPYEMIVSGDWVTPRLNGLRYFEKPPLGYWLNAISISVLGESNFAVRLATTLAAGFTGLLVYLFSLKFYRNRQRSVLAAFIYLSFLAVYLLGTHATLDSLLTLFLTAGIMSYVAATLELQPGRALLYWLACGVTLGLAFLGKGFLAFAVPVLVLVPWLIWQGEWRALLIKGWLVVFVAILVVLPWGLMIHLQESDFWNYFFWVEHIERFTADNAQHREPFYYFLMYLPLLAFPWFGLIPAALNGLAKASRAGSGNSAINRLLWLWFLIPFIFFSMSSGKIATYILPCFPPLALLLANGLYHYFQDSGKNRLFTWGNVFNLLSIALLLLVLIFFQLKGGANSPYASEETLPLVLLITLLVVALVGGWMSIREKRWAVSLALMLGFMLPVMAFMTLSMPLKIIENKAPEKLILEVAPQINEQTVVISAGSMFRAVNWYLKRQDIYLLTTNEVVYGLSYPDSSHLLLSEVALQQMLLDKKAHPVAIFCHRSCPDMIIKWTPDDAFIKEYGSFTFILIQ